MAAFGDLVEQFDPDAHVRGRQFEHICKWYLTHDPVYRRMLRQVWLWDEWPGRKGPDIGIDLVAEDRAGHLWAIQAKAYSPDHTVTKRDIDTFLSASATSEFSFRLLIATTDLIGANARRTVEAQERPVHLHMRTDLAHAEVDWPADPGDLRAPRPPIKSPRPHQQQAIDAVAGGFESHDRGQMIMACGTGKTLTALWITEHLDSDRTLVLVPSLSLLKDTLREWTTQARTAFSFLPVCSDPTVRGGDDWVSSTTELGIPVTTDPDEIAAFLRQDGPLVVFSTYQSSPRVADAQSLDVVPGFDLVIADEAHRVAGPVSSDFATVLDNSAIEARRRLFTTATPRFFTDRVLKEAGEADFEIASMNDDAKFGPEFHRLSFGEAIERDLLSDYQVAIIGVDDPTYRQLANDGVFVTRDGTEVTDARSLASHIGLAKAMHDFDLHKTISFHSRINRARDFAADFPDVVAWMPDDQKPDGDLVTSHVSGKMTAGQRDIRIQNLANTDDHERSLLSNARCLGEGIDVPTLDGVAFIDPRRSHIDIIQAVGRAIRKAEDKTIGTIVLPVFIDTTEDPDAALSSSAFKPIWSVLKALRSHDDNLAEKLDELRRQLGRNGKGLKLPPKLHIDLPTTIGEGFVHAFETRLVESSTANWEFWYGLLLEFLEREGHARVPTDHVENGYLLGSWAHAQRRFYKTGFQITPERISRLNSAKGWVWDAREADWQNGLMHLQRFVEREHHAAVPKGHEEDGFSLYSWVRTRRTEHTQGLLTEERINELEDLDGWMWNVQDSRWERGIRLLRQYANREEHANVARQHVEDGFKLGNWVAYQRSNRDGLSKNRVAALDSVPGWQWNPYGAAWDEGIQHLERFVEREGHAIVRSSHVEQDHQLGRWVATQRSNRSSLDEDRTRRLDQLGFAWDGNEAAWEAVFMTLTRYVEREGHALVPMLHVEDGVTLGRWVGDQRKKHESGDLPIDGVDRLESLEGWTWRTSEAAWEEGYSRLTGFRRREGHARVPQKHIDPDGFRLGAWVRRQRDVYKNQKLETKRVRRLTEIEGWVWDAYEADWEAMRSLLDQFRERERHTLVPYPHIENEVNLGHWVSRQRSSYRKGQLSASRIASLEALPGWTWTAREDD